MFKNYFTIVFRNIKKYKSYSFINIIGLTLGMACTILISLWVLDELNYDRFNDNHENLYRVISISNFGGETRQPATAGPLADLIMKDIPEVENVARYFYHSSNRMTFQFEDKNFKETKAATANPVESLKYE